MKLYSLLLIYILSIPIYPQQNPIFEKQKNTYENNSQESYKVKTQLTKTNRQVLKPLHLLNSSGTIDTLSYNDGTFNMDAQVTGQGWLLQWYEAPADLNILQVGFYCTLNQGNYPARLKIVEVNWPTDSLQTILDNIGYYEAIGNGCYDITAFGSEPNATGSWISQNGHLDPFGPDIWSDGGIGFPFTPIPNIGYQWIPMNILYEPSITRGEIFGIAIKNDASCEEGQIGFLAGMGGVPSWKFYPNGPIVPGEDIGWWTRDLTLDFPVLVELTGDLPPSINSYTIIPSGNVTGPFIIDANITDTNPGDTTNAGVAGASIYFSNDSGMVWNEILMSGFEPDFTGEIPVQNPGSTVSYKILATDINGNVATSLVTTFYIFPPSGANTLIVFNGLEETNGYPQDYYFGQDIQNGLTSFDHDTWSYGVLQEELAELYDNIFEFCTEGPKDYNDSVITNWLAADGSRNYFLAGQEWLGLKNDFRDSIYVAGDFEYDILGVTRSYNNVSFNGTSGQELPSLVFPQEMTLFGGSLFDLFNTNPTDSMQYDPYTIINVDNWIDAFDVLPGQEVDMTVETRGINGVPEIDTLPSHTHRILPNGNKIVFLSYDPLSLDSSPDSLWYGFSNENTPYQALQWFGIPVGVELEEKEDVPTEFLLSQNYPNPFNPTTKIKFTIPGNVILSGAKNLVILKVYDVLGNEIASVVNEEKPAGSYEVDFDATELTSGVYFYQLKAGSFIETKKMIILK
jgi:hypothetical protein